MTDASTSTNAITEDSILSRNQSASATPLISGDYARANIIHAILNDKPCTVTHVGHNSAVPWWKTCHWHEGTALARFS